MLRPTFLSFETAKRALTTSQLGLDTVGHNISNVNTAGFSRQRVDQVSLNYSSYKTKFAAYGRVNVGSGSTVTGVNQIRDPFLDKRYRTEAAGVGEKAAISDGLSDINAIFDEIEKTGIHAKAGDFLKALDALIADASSKGNATALRNVAQQLTQVLNENATSLERVMEQQQSELSHTVTDVNSMLEQIAMLNEKIEDENFYGSPANELNDQRNLLIDQLSEMLDITVIRTPQKVGSDRSIERVSIQLNGTKPPVELVNGDDYKNLEVKFDTDETSANYGTASVHLVDGTSGFAVNLPDVDHNDLTKSLYKGAIKGTLDILNGKGVYASTSDDKTFRGIPHYRQTLNEFAQHLASTLNDHNRIKVLQDDGSGGFTEAWIERPLLVSNDTNGLGASNISVSTEWVEDSFYITTSATNNALLSDSNGELLLKGDPPTSSGIALTDIAQIGPNGQLIHTDGTVIPNVTLDDLARGFTEATTDYGIGDVVPTAMLPGDKASDSLSALKLLFTDQNQTFPNGYTGSFQDYALGFQGDMAWDQKQNDALLEAQLNVLGGIADNRDGVSAVSIDEEAITMMTYQNFYNAAARYMTVLDEAVATIIQNMGQVGR